jgi:6-phospho-3-hexuloisomerase
MFHDMLNVVTDEIRRVLLSVKAESAEELIRVMTSARRIVVHGAGRVGLASKGFAMRLGHLGKDAHAIGDATMPPVAEGDLLVVASSSGETQTVYDVAMLGKKHGAHLAVITAVADSRIAALADLLIIIKAPTKFGPLAGVDSVQPMATLFEQSLQIFFDVIILLLMKRTGQTHADLWARHSNLD